MTSLSTGGYSTKNAGLSYWNSAYVEYVIMFGMCIGAMKLTLFFFALKGDFRLFRQDEETRWFLLFLLIFIVITVVWLFYNGYETGTDAPENTFRKGAFQVISLASTSGFITADFVSWGSFYWLIALILMTVCGCGGSTSGGLKMGRALILIKNTLNEFRKQTHPMAVMPVRINGRAIPHETIYRVHIFVVVYFLLIIFSWLFLLLSGISFEESIGISVSSISNVGASLGAFEDGNLSTLSTLSKWYISFLMLAGRLEIFTVLALFLPGFWRR
jgi:trk system potassium uptake protein TrkH